MGMEKGKLRKTEIKLQKGSEEKQYKTTHIQKYYYIEHKHRSITKSRQ